VWDNRDVLPAHGAVARAVAGGATAPRTSPVKLCPATFPPHRDHVSFPLGINDTRFPGYQSATLTLTATTNWQLVVRFAGRPDRIDIAASAAGVNFRLRNRGDDEADAIRIVNAAFHETYISKDIVEAQDPAGAGGQIVTCHGMFTRQQ
jgi:hypothetical protein